MVDFHHARIDAYTAAGNHLESARETRLAGWSAG